MDTKNWSISASVLFLGRLILEIKMHWICGDLVDWIQHWLAEGSGLKGVFLIGETIIDQKCSAEIIVVTSIVCDYIKMTWTECCGQFWLHRYRNDVESSDRMPKRLTGCCLT